MVNRDDEKNKPPPVAVSFVLRGSNAYWARVLASRDHKSIHQWARDVMEKHLKDIGYGE